MSITNDPPFPHRNLGWHIHPVELQLCRSEDATWVGVVIDTSDVRLVTWWTASQLERIAREMLRYLGRAPDGLVLESLPRLGDLPPHSGAQP